MLQLDPNLLALAGVTGLVGYVFGEMRKPGKRQEQLMLMALAGLAAYAFRQFEGRGNRVEDHSVNFAALETRVEERFKTVFKDISDINRKLDSIVDTIAERLTAPRRRRR